MGSVAAQVTATATANGFRIDGIKDRVEAGADSDLLLVVAATDGRSAAVPGAHRRAGDPRVETQRCIDLVKTYARVSFDGSRSTDPRQWARPPRPRRSIARQTQIALVLQCAETVGILSTVFDLTVQWGFDRHSFGRPLVSHQALKHKSTPT